jgi:uncharacterized protein (TIGR03086 family)
VAPSAVLAAGLDRWLCDGMSSDTATQVLARGLDQLETLLRSVREDDRGRPTPCSDWTVSDLVDHVVQAPWRSALMVRGDQVDWAAPTPHVDDPVAAYRENAQALRAALAELPDAQPGADWHCAEIAVHTWDLATALGRSTDTFDPEVADLGRAFMQASLTDDNRSPAFGPERRAPEGADAYTRIAAFAGRAV